MRRARLYRDGEPCRKGRACLVHASHPCEGCGRVQGRNTITSLVKIARERAGSWTIPDTTAVCLGMYAERYSHHGSDDNLKVQISTLGLQRRLYGLDPFNPAEIRAIIETVHEAMRDGYLALRTAGGPDHDEDPSEFTV